MGYFTVPSFAISVLISPIFIAQFMELPGILLPWVFASVNGGQKFPISGGIKFPS
jgi:hypothetical protein